MKKAILTLTLISLLSIGNNYAQRYLKPVFDSVVFTDSVPFGAANNYLNVNTPLAMDIYMPYKDTAAKRPLLMLAHGGSFTSGDRKSPDIVVLCNEFAKRGYVCVSIDYRLGVNVNSPGTFATQFADAVWRGTLDGRAALRYINKTARNGNLYKIDTNNIYIGGVSAGGVLGLHVAFLDKANEAGNSFPAIDTAGIGGVEGRSGNPGYSWKVKGIINLCGALGHPEWMNDNRDYSIVSVHGTNDNTVPFKTDYFKVAGVIPVALLSGSYVVDSVARANGNVSALRVFPGQDHVPFANFSASGIAYMDTTVKFVANFLFSDIKRASAPAAIYTTFAENIALKIFPVPAQDAINVVFENTNNISFDVELFDINGKQLLSKKATSNQIKIERNNVPNGLYLLRIKSDNGEYFKRIIFE